MSEETTPMLTATIIVQVPDTPLGTISEDLALPGPHTDEALTAFGVSVGEKIHEANYEDSGDLQTIIRMIADGTLSSSDVLMLLLMGGRDLTRRAMGTKLRSML